MSAINFQPELMTKSIAYCLREDCLLATGCLRFLTFQHAAPFLAAATLDPRSTTLGQDCPHFADARLHRLAHGFREGYSYLRLRDQLTFQSLAKAALNCERTLFYEYLNGSRPLYPSQQELLRAIFSNFNVTVEPFDRYSEGYIMPAL